MTLYVAPWEKYLKDKTGQSLTGGVSEVLGEVSSTGGVLESSGGGAVKRTDMERLQRQYTANQAIAQSLGTESTGKTGKGILSKALDVITLPGAILTAGVKEFIFDPLYTVAETMVGSSGNPDVAQKDVNKNANTYHVSLEEFKNNVKNRNFAQDIYGFLDYGKNASFFEKAAKEIAGFGIDVISSGGTGTGVKAASVLGRAAIGKTSGQIAKEVFKKNIDQVGEDVLTKLGAEVGGIEKAADLFGSKVAQASLNGRSREVLDVFKDTFGKDIGVNLFKELPKELQGGLQVSFRGKTLANFNSGGQAVDAVARVLNIPQLTQSTEKAVKTFQGLKNTLRADTITNPKVANAVGAVNNILNKLGGENAKAWQSFVKASVSKAKDDDLVAAFKGMEAVDTIQNLRNIRYGFVRPTLDFMDDTNKLAKSNPEAWKKAEEFMGDTALLDNFVPVTELDNIAVDFATRYRNEYDRYLKLLEENGFDVNYLEDYYPALFATGDDVNKFAEAVAAGSKNIKGAGYDPTKSRKMWLKEKVDSTGKVIEVPMTPFEIKAKLIELGMNDLAEQIITDPRLLLSRYSTNVSRLLANKTIAQDLLDKGVLFKSNIFQLGLDEKNLTRALGQLRPKDVNQFLTDFMARPGALGDYTSKLNDDLIKAYSINDEEAIKAVEGKVGQLIDSVESVKKGLSLKKKRLLRELSNAKEAHDEARIYAANEKLLELEPFAPLIAAELKRLGVKYQRNIDQTVNTKVPISAKTLAEREGIQYQPVGTSDLAKDVNFYLPKDLANLHGDQAIVDLIDRKLLLGVKNDPEFMKTIDEYTQFFRTGATFGKLTGFVLRNGFGAVQNNFLIAGSNAADHAISKDIMSTLIYTDFGLAPFKNLSRKDLVSKRLDKLVEAGRLNPELEALIRKDLNDVGWVKSNTIATVREAILKEKLSAKSIVPDAKILGLRGKVKTKPEEISQWDAYEAMKKAGIFDEYRILPTANGMDVEDQVAEFLQKDSGRFVLNATKSGDERGIGQKVGEGILNMGFTVKADVAGREYRIKPLQLTRDLNKIMEEYVRGAPIITGLRKYGDSEGGINAATLLMKAAQFDYSDLTPFEQKVMRRALPFYTYMRKNVPAQARVMMNDPMRLAANLRGWDLVKNIFSDEEGNTYVVPDYIGQMFGFVVDDKYRKDLLKKSPDWLKPILQSPLAFKPESPAFDLETYSKGGLEGAVQTFLSASNPLSKEILQYALNENFFKNRKYSPRGVPAPSWFQKLDTAVKIVSAGQIDLNVRKDASTGKIVTDERNLDLFRTLIPILGTVERSGLPVVDIGIEALTGKNPNLSGQLTEKAGGALLSQILGLGFSNITPSVELGTVYNRNYNVNDNIYKIAGDKNIDIQKIRQYTNTLVDQGLPQDEIIATLIQANRQGLFAPDVVG